MKWYVAMLFLLVGLVWSVSAQQMHPRSGWHMGDVMMAPFAAPVCSPFS